MADLVDPKGTFEKLVELTNDLNEATAQEQETSTAAERARSRAQEAAAAFKLARFKHLIATRSGGVRQEDFAREVERFARAREEERAEMLARELART